MSTVNEIVQNLFLCDYTCNAGSLKNNVDFQELVDIANNGEYVEKMFNEFQKAKNLLQKVIKHAPPDFLDTEWGVEILGMLLDK